MARFLIPLLAGALLGLAVGNAPCAAAAPAQDGPAARPAPQANSMVKLWVLAEGRGRKLALDLNAGDFQVLDDGHPQHVTYFARRSTEPLSLGILVETSRGRLYEPEPVDWEAYSKLLRKLLRPGDQAVVATFAEKAVLLNAFTSDLTKLDAALQQAFSTPPHGTIALYDAICSLADEPFAGVPGRKALLVISDSPDDSSFHTQVQTVEKIQRTGLTVYALLPWVDRAEQPNYGSAQAAQFFTNQTGGLFFIAFSRKALLADIDGIAAALAYTYTLGYVPSKAAHDGRFHSVKVKCSRPGLKIHASEGYYAGQSPPK